MRILFEVLTIIILPLHAMALTPLADSELSSVTGQAGVSINPDITLNLSLSTLAWGDADGIVPGPYSPASWGTSSDGGYFGLEDFVFTNLVIRSRSTDNYNGYDCATMWKPLTIDVATGGAHNADMSFIRLGIGAIEITAEEINGGFGLAAHSGFTGNLDQDLLDGHIGDLALYFNPASFIDIYNNRGSGTSGLTFALDVGIDQWNMGELSFGDKDGLGAGIHNEWIGDDSRAGWIGFKNVSISDILIKGTINVDVVHVTSGIYASFDGPTTVIRFDFTDCSLEIDGPATAELRLGDTPSLNNVHSETMCDFSLSDASLQVAGWLDLWAH